MTLPNPFPKTDDIYQTRNPAFVLFGSRFCRSNSSRAIGGIVVWYFPINGLALRDQLHHLCRRCKTLMIGHRVKERNSYIDLQ